MKMLAETSCAGCRTGVEMLSPPKTGTTRGAPRNARGTGKLGLQAGVRLGSRSGSTGVEHEIAAFLLLDQAGPSISCMEGPCLILPDSPAAASSDTPAI